MAESTISVRLAGEAKGSIDKVVDRVGLSQQKVVTRALEWFGAQDEGTQALILKLIPESYEGEVARAVLDRMDAAEAEQKDVAGTIKPEEKPTRSRKSKGVGPRKRAAKKMGQDESRGGKRP